MTEAVTSGADEEHATPGELALLAFMTFVLVLFLATARSYSPAAAMFPNLVCSAGLIFIVWRFLIIVRHIAVGGSGWLRNAAILHGRMSWQWSAALMVGSILCMYVLGFIIGSILFVIAVINLTGDRRRARSVVIGIATAAAMYLLSKIVHLQLPLGFLDFMR